VVKPGHLRQTLAGENIIVQGETGNTFYIMFSGTVDVFKEQSRTFVLGDKRVKELTVAFRSSS
jgi:CRP-like cAMP-binding protein